MYKTKSLDTAAYIYSQGHECKIRPLNDSHAEFTFDSKDAERLAKKYLSGEVVMSLHKYQHSRLQLKILGSKENATYKVKQEQKRTKRKKMEKPFVLNNGSSYYYKHHGQVMHGVWENTPEHVGRLNSDNVYRTAEEIEI